MFSPANTRLGKRIIPRMEKIWRERMHLVLTPPITSICRHLYLYERVNDTIMVCACIWVNNRTSVDLLILWKVQFRSFLPFCQASQITSEHLPLEPNVCAHLESFLVLRPPRRGRGSVKLIFTKPINGILESLDPGPGLWTQKWWTLDRDLGSMG